MTGSQKWQLTEKEKDAFISALTPQLSLLRTQADISQEELAALIGVSRQTYGAIERKTRKMTWNTYLSLILFYDYNRKTHQLLRITGAFPTEIVDRFNDGRDPDATEIGDLFSADAKEILGKLDDQARRSIRTMILLEYARCTETPGDVVIKSFDGKSFFNSVTQPMVDGKKALKAIKGKRDVKG